MRVNTQGLNIGFVYPCSKKDVVEVFGQDLLWNVRFETKRTEYRDEKPLPTQSKVLAKLYFSPREPREVFSETSTASLEVYQLEEGRYSAFVRNGLVRIMAATLRPWLLHCFESTTDASTLRSAYAFVCFGDRGFEVYEQLRRNARQEIRSLPFD